MRWETKVKREVGVQIGVIQDGVPAPGAPPAQSPRGTRAPSTAMAPVQEEKKPRGRPKGGGGKGAHLKKPKEPKVPSGRPRGRPVGPEGPKERYVPTGAPKGRPKGSRDKRGDHLRKTPWEAKTMRFGTPTGKPRGRPKKAE